MTTAQKTATGYYTRALAQAIIRGVERHYAKQRASEQQAFPAEDVGMDDVDRTGTQETLRCNELVKGGASAPPLATPSSFQDSWSQAARPAEDVGGGRAEHSG